MKRQKSFCMTLRLPPQLDELVSEACYESRMSKAEWIRAAINQSLRSLESRNWSNRASQGVVNGTY
jgi:hypothetical protein